MQGRTVITSKEQMPYFLAIEKLRGTAYEKEEKQSMIIWKFENKDDAIKNAGLFVNIGFQYVQRT